jgi:hypothetical protein
MVAVVITIAAPAMLTLLAAIVLKKDAHRVVAWNALDAVLVTVAQDPVNAQTDILVLRVNASPAQMAAMAKVHAIPQQVCAVVLVDTLAMIVVHVYAQKAMIH